jgi:hypothetical protein
LRLSFSFEIGESSIAWAFPAGQSPLTVKRRGILPFLDNSGGGG